MTKEEMQRKMRQATESEARGLAAHHGTAEDSSSDGPPQGAISIQNTTIAAIGDQIQEKLAAHPDPGFVIFSGVPHRIVSRVVAGGVRHITQVHSLSSLRGYVLRKMSFVRRNKDGQYVPANPPKDAIEDLLTLPAYDERIPVVDFIQDVPFFTDDGELISTSGLYPEHRVFLDLDPGLEGMQVPEEISDEDVAEAFEVITDPFIDFPFDGPSSANFIGMLFAMVFRAVVKGLTPLFVLDANRASTGKSTLASVMSVIAYGRRAEFGSGNVDSDELRKRLFALVAQGARFHVLDNVEKKVWSPELAAFLTAAEWGDRKLGSSETYTYPNRLTIAVTGNHVSIGGDIARRAVLIRLLNEHDLPEQRADYKHDSVIDHALQQRPQILQAMYTVIAAWHRAGRPIPADAPRMGSFQEWVNFSAGILHTVWKTSESLLANRDEMRGCDTDAQEYELMLVRGRQAYGNGTFLARDLVGELDADDLPSILAGRVTESRTKSMGRLLMRLEGRAFGDMRLTVRAAGKQDHANLYRIESDEDRDPVVLDASSNSATEEASSREQDAAA